MRAPALTFPAALLQIRQRFRCSTSVCDRLPAHRPRGCPRRSDGRGPRCRFEGSWRGPKGAFNQGAGGARGGGGILRCRRGRRRDRSRRAYGFRARVRRPVPPHHFPSLTEGSRPLIRRNQEGGRADKSIRLPMGDSRAGETAAMQIPRKTMQIPREASVC